VLPATHNLLVIFLQVQNGRQILFLFVCVCVFGGVKQSRVTVAVAVHH